MDNTDNKEDEHNEVKIEAKVKVVEVDRNSPDYIQAHYLNVQAIYLRASALNKSKFMKNLFQEISEVKSMRITFQIMWKYFMGKMNSYLKTLDRSTYIHDIQQVDNNRMIDQKELDDFFAQSLTNFRQLDNDEKRLELFQSLLFMSGDDVIRQVLLEMAACYKRVTSRDYDIAFGPNIVTEKSTEELEVVDEGMERILDARKVWNDNINKYRSKMEQAMGLGKTTSKATTKATMSDKSKKQSKKDSKKKSKKDSKSKTKKGKTKSVAASPVIDYMQLLPVWIVCRIFSYLDAKTLNAMKTVSKHCNFIVDYMSEEGKCRKKFQMWIDELKSELGEATTDFMPQITHYERRFKSQDAYFKNQVCDKQLHRELKAEAPQYTPMHVSLVGEIANQSGLPFLLPQERIVPFAREIELDDAVPVDPSVHYLHQRSSIARVDRTIVPLVKLQDMTLAGEALVADDTSSESCAASVELDNIRLSAIDGIGQPRSSLYGNRRSSIGLNRESQYVSHWKQFYNDEIDMLKNEVHVKTREKLARRASLASVRLSSDSDIPKLPRQSLVQSMLMERQSHQRISEATTSVPTSDTPSSTENADKLEETQLRLE